MANVDPFVIQWPRQWMSDPEIRPVVEYLNRFLHDLFIRTGGGDDAIEAAAGEEVSLDAEVSRLLALNNNLSKRVKDLEESNDFQTLSAQILRINRRVDSLIKSLIDEVKKLRDVELENKFLCVQESIHLEMELLNARIEEAFETHIESEDL